MEGKAARAYTVAYSDFGRAPDAGYYRLVGRPLRHMGERQAKGQTERNECARQPLQAELGMGWWFPQWPEGEPGGAGEPGEPARTATMKRQIDYLLDCPSRA